MHKMVPVSALKRSPKPHKQCFFPFFSDLYDAIASVCTDFHDTVFRKQQAADKKTFFFKETFYWTCSANQSHCSSILSSILSASDL